MRRALLLILVLAFAAGCRKERSVIGQWSTRADMGTGTLIFRDDSTFRAVRETPLMTLVLDGTFECKGENLRMHIVKWSVPKGPTIKEADRRDINHAFQTDAISTVTWSDEDHIRISGANGELTTAQRISK